MSVVLALVGGILSLLYRVLLGDDEPYFHFLLALGIGVTIGYIANHEHRRVAIVIVAAGCAVGSSVVGNFCVAALVRAANSQEFNREALSTDEFFIALEAYLSKYKDDSSSPAFTDAANRLHYSESEWTAASTRWHDKTDDEQESIRGKWQTDFANLSRLGDEGVANVFEAAWNLRTYAIAAAIAGGIVVIIQRDERSW